MKANGRLVLVLAAMAGLLSMPVQASSAEPSDAVTAETARIMRLAEEQLAAAKRDQSLVDDVSRQFYGRRAGKDGSAAVDAALEPLRKAFPDARLRFRDADDFCKVQRVLRNARVAAGRRLIEALQIQRQALDRIALYNSVLLNFRVKKLTGESLTEADVERAFLNVMRTDEPVVVQRGWTSLDYLEFELSADDCP